MDPATAGGTVKDIRARLDQRVILGLSGLPHPAFAETPGEHTRPDLSGPGFSCLLLPHTGASLLRLELRDQTDRWTEFFRTVITAPGETALVPAAGLSTAQRDAETGEKDYGLTAADITSLCDRTLAEGFGYANYPDTPGYGISISQPT